MLRVVIPFYSEFESAKEGLRSMKDAGMEFVYTANQGALIYAARNRGVNDGKNQRRMQEPLPGFSHFLFVDADISFTAEHVKTLLELDVPVATCPYLCHEHDAQKTYQCGELSLVGQILSRDKEGTRGVKARSFAGSGFLLVHRDVFRQLPYPWFHHRMVERYDFREQCGEDVGFCLALREEGFKIQVDFDHPVTHKLRKHADYSWQL